MPISSGALGWPTSHFNKHDEYKDTLPTSGNGMTAIPGAVPKPSGNGGYTWQVQLTGREEYEGWKLGYDKEAKKAFKKRRKQEKKRKKEQRKMEKQQMRDTAEEVLTRQRRRKCLLLSVSMTLVSALVMFGAIALYTSYLEEDTLGPPVYIEKECEGLWRKHYLVYNAVYSNGTTTYTCCYLPDVNATYRASVLSKPAIWPDGFVIPPSACPSHRGPCKFYEAKNLFDSGTPPCSSVNFVNPSLCGLTWATFIVFFCVNGCIL